MCLLHALADVLDSEQLAVAHYNHRTRGLENEKDATLVKETADKFGLQYFTDSRKQIGAASELDLRNQRREFLEAVAEEHHFDFICTAHHANDQLETLLMRLLRGTDWKGMGAIRYRRDKWLRPLLGASRDEIEKYAKKHSVPFRTDGSNYQTKYLRNSIRHGVAQEFLLAAENSGVSKKAALDNVSHWCLRAQEIFDFLESHTRVLIADLVTETPFWIRVNHARWETVPKTLQSFVLNELASKYLGKSLCRKQLKLWRQYLEKKRKRFDLKEGVHVRVSHGHWYLMLGEGEPAFIPERGPNPLTLRFPDARTEVTLTNAEMPCEPRYFRPGDRFQTNGKKLKEIFQRKRLPAPERKLIPVLARPGTSEVVWYLGVSEDSEVISQKRCDFPFTSL